MYTNPLIQLLSALSRREISRFVEFSHSPYFNKHKDVRRLAEYLGSIYPDFNEKKCGREVVFQQLYPALPHQQPQLAIVFSYTLRLLEQFLIVELAGAERILEDKTLYYRQLRHRNLASFLKTNWEENTTGVQKRAFISGGVGSAVRPSDGVFFYENKFRKAAEQDAIAMRLGQPGLGFLAEKQTWLDAFYLTEKLRDACELCQRSKLLKTQFQEEGFLKKALEILRESPDYFIDFPPVAVYFNLYNLLKNNDLNDYRPTLEIIYSNEPAFPKTEAQNLYNYLQNFCIEQINRGNQQFLREVFNLYQVQLENGLLLVDDVLPEWHFKNIVTTGLRLDERAWVRSFLENYRPRLDPKVAENAYSFNLAAWFYHVGKPDEVLRLLLQVEYTDLRYNLDAKSLLLRTYFDLEEEEALMALTEAFKQFLKRNKTLTDFQKKGYFNLLKFTARAFRLKMERDFTSATKWQESLKKLTANMAAADTIFNQTWLEGKVAELEIEKF